MCLFIAFAALDDETCLPALVDLINARFGISLTADDVVSLGKNILKTEKGFNEAAGFTNADDRLPEFFSTEPFPHTMLSGICQVKKSIVSGISNKFREYKFMPL